MTRPEPVLVSPVAEDLLTGLRDLPSLPAVLVDALNQLDDRRADAAAVVEKIGRDPPLVARILHIANSPFFGLPREIASLREAIVMIGINRVRELLVSAVFPRLFPPRGGAFNHKAFWIHSMTTAVCARQIAGYASLSQECAFTAGLLHDIGRLVLGCLYPSLFARVLDEAARREVDLLTAESQVLGIDHAVLGGKVADRWNFPEGIARAIAHHHDSPVEGGSQPMEIVVHAADLLTAGLGRPGADHQGTVFELRASLEALRIKGELLEPLLQSAHEIQEQSGMFFSGG